MSIWKLLGRLVKISPETLWLITDESQGRLIYEKYDESGKTSKNSEYFIVNFAKVFPRLKSEDEAVQGILHLDLADSEMVKPLTDD